MKKIITNSPSSPKVSIILCTYNRPLMLKKAIKGVIKQTYSNWELIIIDDGSEIETKKIVNNIKDKRIHYFYKKNSGVYDSTNFGLKKINGEFFCFCDDDDIFLPNKLLQQVRFLEKNRAIDGCFSDYIVSKESIQKNISLEKSSGPFLVQILKESVFANSCFLFRSKKIKFILFNTKLNGTEATIADWLCNIATKHTIIYAKAYPVVEIQRHKANMTNQLKAMRSLIPLLRYQFKKNFSKFTEQQKKELNASIYFREGKYYFWNHQYALSQKSFLQSLMEKKYNIQALFFFFFTIFGGESTLNVFLPFYEIVTGKIYIKDCS